ncbi:hypothetical protein GCM10010442_35880 [Kitasatospora kifunensis]
MICITFLTARQMGRVVGRPTAVRFHLIRACPRPCGQPDSQLSERHPPYWRSLHRSLSYAYVGFTAWTEALGHRGVDPDLPPPSARSARPARAALPAKAALSFNDAPTTAIP